MKISDVCLIKIKNMPVITETIIKGTVKNIDIEVMNGGIVGWEG